jgi:death-on-curing family protein
MSQKAAALVQSGATNHGFIDGNKRTTLILLNLLLAKSGYAVALNNQEANAELEKIILAAVKHEMTLDAIENWFRRHLVKSQV